MPEEKVVIATSLNSVREVSSFFGRDSFSQESPSPIIRRNEAKLSRLVFEKFLNSRDLNAEFEENVWITYKGKRYSGEIRYTPPEFNPPADADFQISFRGHNSSYSVAMSVTLDKGTTIPWSYNEVHNEEGKTYEVSSIYSPVLPRDQVRAVNDNRHTSSLRALELIQEITKIEKRK